MENRNEWTEGRDLVPHVWKDQIPAWAERSNRVSLEASQSHFPPFNPTPQHKQILLTRCDQKPTNLLEVESLSSPSLS